jgi:hypothetical protein
VILVRSVGKFVSESRAISGVLQVESEEPGGELSPVNTTICVSQPARLFAAPEDSSIDRMEDPRAFLKYRQPSARLYITINTGNQPDNIL